MPEFVNPFSGKVADRQLTLGELVRALRLDLAAEHEAVHLYSGPRRCHRSSSRQEGPHGYSE